jgi:DNA polymerase III alpha subunit (gram-positive type)
VKVENGQIVDEFQSFVRPWDANKASRQSAAKEAGVSLSVIEGAEDVDQVMVKFFDFVGEDVLVSTGALGNQAKLLTRAARHSGMREIKNEFYDILDLAADTSVKFDLANNTRGFLLSYFLIAEGTTALEKAKVNVELYNKLTNYGE